MNVGVMRKTESRIQRAFEGAFGRTFRSYAQPVEVAQKLAKEMDEGCVRSPSRTYAPNVFAVYFCPRDREHFRPIEAALAKEFEAHLLLHAREERYDLVGPPQVSIASDDDLKLGFFGIRAEPVRPSPARSAESSARMPRGAPASPPSPVPSFLAAPPTGAAALRAADLPPGQAAGGARAPGPDDTVGISAKQARELRLARRVLVLSDRRNTREFQQGRVVLGRSREADFPVEDGNVSRRHALLYWEDDRVFVKDLGSTNGTFVNGRPVTAGPVVDGDVISLGNSSVSVRIP